MSEQKKTPGRPQIYQGWQDGTVRGTRGQTQQVFSPRHITESEGRTPARREAVVTHGNIPAPGADRPARRSENSTVQVQAKRYREQENEAKMRVLWGVLGVLAVLLVVAIIYEIILGHGMKETGAERMAVQDQETIVEILKGTGQTEGTGESEPMSETAQVGDNDTAAGTQTEQPGEKQSEGQSTAEADSGTEAS